MIGICVFASGGGTDFQSIIDAVEREDIDGRIVLLLSNNKDAGCIERAKKQGIEHIHIDHRGKTQEKFEIEVGMVMGKYGPDLIVLAGWLRILSPQFMNKWQGRMINIHPALLPLFAGKGMYGERVHKAVLESGMKVSGCSVHFVDSSVDGGPIILQRCVPVLENDDCETLAARVLEQEHILLPKAVRLFAEGRLKIEGNKVKIKE